MIGGSEGGHGGIRIRSLRVLDPAKRLLLRRGIPQPVTPKAFDVLLLLVEWRERVLSKEELLRTLWPDTFVEESNLSQQIFVLRRTLNGNSESTEYIATIPRQGYRFTADVRERSGDEAPAAVVETEPRSRLSSSWPVLSLALALSAVGALLMAILAVGSRDDCGRLVVR